MKLSGRIVVEPLDEERLTNIERRIVSGAVDAAARAQPPRRITGRVLAVAAVVTAGLAGWALHAPPRVVVAEPAAIRVDTSPRHATLDLGDAQIASDPDTAFAVTRPGGGVLVAMTRGKIELEVGKRGGRPPLIVRAGDTDVIVVGTRFTVDYGDGHGEVSVRVTEGVVRVVHQQQETRVAAGSAWRTHGGLIAARDDASAAREATSAAGGDPARDPIGAEVPGATPASATRSQATGETVRGRPPVAIATGVAPDVLRDRTAAVPDARAAPPAAATVHAAPARPLAGAAPARAAVPSDPRTDLRGAIRGQPIEPALDLGEPNAERAVTRYYDIAAHQSGEAASQAFYSIAVVRYLRLARNAEALQTLDAYVRRFPGGKEYRAALWLRVRILCLDKIDDRCRAAAYTFGHEAPEAAAARVAERITLSD
jgi:FecR protein